VLSKLDIPVFLRSAARDLDLARGRLERRRRRCGPDTVQIHRCHAHRVLGVGNEYGIGWASPATKVKTLPSEVELLGTETQEDRDVELRKRAVDVENADPSPAKKGKSG